MKTRSLFATKTALFNYVVAALAIWPDGAQFVADNAQAVLIGISLLGLGVRAITKGKVNLFGGE